MERQHELWDKQMLFVLTSFERGVPLLLGKVERVAAQVVLRLREKEPLKFMSSLW